jgi:hypothetical protein
MKPILFAAASLILIAPEALARDLIRVGAPVEQAGFFPQSTVWSAPDLKGGPSKSAPLNSSTVRIIKVSSGASLNSSGIRIFRGGAVSEVGRVGTPNADPSLSGKTIVRLKKRPQNPYKTVIIYTPKSVREVRADRKAD